MVEKRVPGRPNRKAEIVAATEALVRKHGVGGVTTKGIAAAVPCSEGAIYVHFKDRLELFLAVLQESLPAMAVPLRALEMKVGQGDARRNLETALVGLERFHERVAPMLCSMMGEPELLRRFRASLHDEGKGPNKGIATLGKYIEQEQKLGRIAKSVNAMSAAQILMASSFFHVFTICLMDRGGKFDVKGLVESVFGPR